LTTDQVLLAPDQVVFDDNILGNISLQEDCLSELLREKGMAHSRSRFPSDESNFLDIPDKSLDNNNEAEEYKTAAAQPLTMFIDTTDGADQFLHPPVDLITGMPLFDEAFESPKNFQGRAAKLTLDDFSFSVAEENHMLAEKSNFLQPFTGNLNNDLYGAAEEMVVDEAILLPKFNLARPPPVNPDSEPRLFEFDLSEKRPLSPHFGASQQATPSHDQTQPNTPSEDRVTNFCFDPKNLQPENQAMIPSKKMESLQKKADKKVSRTQS